MRLNHWWSPEDGLALASRGTFSDPPPAPSGGGAPPPPPVAQAPGPPVAAAPPPIVMPAPTRPATGPHHEPSPSAQRPSGATEKDLEELSGLRRARAELEAQVTELRQLETTARARARVAEQNAAMAGEVSHPDVQRLFRRGFEDYEADTKTAGKAPVDFDAWYRSEHVRQSPVYSALFRAPPSAATGQPPAPALPPARPPAPVHGGERAPGGSPAAGVVTDDTIGQWAGDPVGWRGEKGHGRAAREAIEARLGRKLGNGQRTPSGGKFKR